MLQVCPSMFTRTLGLRCSTATASSSVRTASGRRLYRSKSKCTSSNTIGAATSRRTTWIVVVSVAVLPSLGQVTRTVTGTGPGVLGAVHGVFCAVGLLSVPAGALHAYVTVQPIESVTWADTVDTWPTSTVHGLQLAR